MDLALLCRSFFINKPLHLSHYDISVREGTSIVTKQLWSGTCLMHEKF